jgi:hypothetical protein
MTWVAPASKAAAFAEVISGKRKPSEEQKECYLLKRLPRGSLSISLELKTGPEIRDNIWRLLFTRPCALAPGFTHHEWMTEPYKWIPRRFHHGKVYRYQ